MLAVMRASHVTEEPGDKGCGGFIAAATPDRTSARALYYSAASMAGMKILGPIRRPDSPAARRRAHDTANAPDWLLPHAAKAFS
jgi:hypothetical protein